MLIPEKMNLCNKDGVTEITRYGSCTINGNVTVEAPAFINANCKIECSSIGAFSFINSSVIICNTDTIGRFVMIDSNCTIGISKHPVDFLSSHISFKTNRFFGEKSFYDIASIKDFQKKYLDGEKEYNANNEKINIGNDVWIGSNSIVHNGVTIGNGAIIEAGSVVKDDVPPYTIVGGNPAQIIKKRFSNEMIEKLLEIRWWDFGPDIMSDIDFTTPTMETLYALDNKIIEKFPIMKCPVYCFNNLKKTISRIETDDTELFFNNASGKITKGGISDNNVGIINRESGLFKIHGWFLPVYSYDNVKIYIDNIFIGDALTHLKRTDVSKNEASCASPFCGWKLETILPSQLLNCTSGHIVVENNGNVILNRKFSVTDEKKENK